MNITVLAGMVPIILGLVQALKAAGLPTRFAPIVSVVIGVGCVGLVSGSFGISSILIGVITGLSSAGLWSGVKATASPVTAG